MAVEAKSVVSSLREVMQDLLVPDLKAVKVSIDSWRSETKVSLDSLRQEMRLRYEMSAQAMRGLSEKLDYAFDIR
jgi:hypothetical protein